MEAILTPPPKVAKHNLMEGPGPSPAPEELKLNFSNFNVKVAPVKETNKQDQATMTTQKRQDINLPGTNETKEALDSISTKWDSEKVYDPMFNLLIEVEQDYRNMLKTIYPSQDHHNMSGNGTGRINRCLNYTSISHGYNTNFTCKRSTVINMFFNKPMATHKESLLQLKFEFTDLNPNIILMTTRSKHHLTSTESEEAQTPV